jgi:hypothetical protein
MIRYEWPLTALTIALHRGLHLAIIMSRYEEPRSVFTIALQRGLFLAIILHRYEGPLNELILPCIEASS